MNIKKILITSISVIILFASAPILVFPIHDDGMLYTEKYSNGDDWNKAVELIDEWKDEDALTTLQHITSGNDELLCGQNAAIEIEQHLLRCDANKFYCIQEDLDKGIIISYYLGLYFQVNARRILLDMRAGLVSEAERRLGKLEAVIKAFIANSRLSVTSLRSCIFRMQHKEISWMGKYGNLNRIIIPISESTWISALRQQYTLQKN
jgi:hypothetical protein